MSKILKILTQNSIQFIKPLSYSSILSYMLSQLWNYFKLSISQRNPNLCTKQSHQTYYFFSSINFIGLFYLSNSKPRCHSYHFSSLTCLIQSIFKHFFALSISRCYPSIVITSATDLFLALVLHQLDYLGSFQIGFTALFSPHPKPFLAIQL